MMTKKMLTGIAVVALVGTLSAAAFAAPAAGRGRGAGMRTGMGALQNKPFCSAPEFFSRVFRRGGRAIICLKTLK